MCACMYACKARGDYPRKFFKIGCSENAFEAVLGQKQSCSSCMVHRVLHPFFLLYICAFAGQVMSNFHERRHHCWQNSIVDGDPLEGRLVNSRAPEIVIYLRTYLHTYLCVSFHRSSANRLNAHSAGCIAATDLVWTAVILNGSEASGPLAKGRALKMYS